MQPRIVTALSGLALAGLLLGACSAEQPGPSGAGAAEGPGAGGDPGQVNEAEAPHTPDRDTSPRLPPAERQRPAGHAHEDALLTLPDRPDISRRLTPLAVGQRAPVKVTFAIDAPGRLEEASIAYRGARYAVSAGDRLLIGEVGNGAVACGALGDAACVQLDDAALEEVAAALFPAGLAPLVAIAQGEVLPGPLVLDTIEQRRIVAGRLARCGPVTADRLRDAGASAVQVCADARTGVGLTWEIERPGVGVTELTATAVDDARVADFRPPEEPIDPLANPEPSSAATVP